jgi:hypothetical protein
MRELYGKLVHCNARAMARIRRASALRIRLMVIVVWVYVIFAALNGIVELLAQ